MGFLESMARDMRHPYIPSTTVVEKAAIALTTHPDEWAEPNMLC